VDGDIPFLDVLLHRNDDGTVTTNFFQKPISSGRILNFNSCHTTSMKMNIAFNLVKRVYSYSQTATEKEKFDTVSNLLTLNGYPKRVILGIISRYKSSLNIEPRQNEKKIPFSSVLQVKGLTSYIQRKIQQNNGGIPITSAYKHGVREIFSNLKDPVELFERTKLIYNIDCKQCEKSYVGLVSRQSLDKRLKQHRRDQNNCLTQGISKTALCDHVRTTSHLFDFENTKVLSTNNHYNKLKILEMLEITKNQNSCNQRSDVSNTISQYQGLLTYLKNSKLM